MWYSDKVMLIEKFIHLNAYFNKDVKINELSLHIKKQKGAVLNLIQGKYKKVKIKMRVETNEIKKNR